MFAVTSILFLFLCPLSEENGMRFVKASPSEYLVIGRRGKIVNRGTAASAFLWPGSTYVLIPSTQQEATFEMTQESKDSIPLRFKGIVIYRIIDAEVAARRFDFTAGGHEKIKALISHVCLGELRATVAHLTMVECIEQRKTTLTDSVASAIRQVIQGTAQSSGWGIELDVVQVAQVFVVDTELRRQLEAEVRNTIKSRSELSEIQMREGIRIAQTTSERRLLQEDLHAERERTQIAREKIVLKQDYEREQLEAETPVRMFRIEKEGEILRKELDKYRLEVEVNEQKTEAALVPERARQSLRKEILPLEQTPAVAQALAQLFKGMNLSIYGQDASALASLTPVVEMLTHHIRESRPASKTASE
jgi:flotillin